MSISLISNSGIQFHTVPLEINPRTEVIRPMGFHEFVDLDKGVVSLEYAYYLPDDDIWVGKKELEIQGYLTEEDKLVEDININTLRPLVEERDFFPISSIEDSLDKYENVWLPIPYFKKGRNQKSAFGPFAWARVMLKRIPDTGQPQRRNRERIRNYEAILAFDTKISPNETVYYTPSYDDTVEGQNIFALSNNEDHNLNFCLEEYHCGWVNEYLVQHVHKSDAPPAGFPSLKYLANYLYLIKYLSESQVFPEVQFYSDRESSIDVDLVLDIGNSNTCAILFESPNNEPTFKFTSVKKLILQDLSEPGLSYDGPFSMRLAFSKPQFGEVFIPGYQNAFKWPSLLRVGKEAKRLISKYNIDPNKATETATHHSSPKRYLWDKKKAEIPWEFVQGGDAYFEGISEQFTSSGAFDDTNEFGVLPNYSKSSLMTFVYLEIFLHALAQINSHAFREDHDGAIEKPRKLKRITITCPTSIVQEEQVILRKYALEAAKVLKKFQSDDIFIDDFENDIQVDFDIVPGIKDLAKKLNVLDSRKDWIYDEATCSQLVFLYGEISQRYLNEAETFFNLFGKKRNDVFDEETKALTIGTLDIGGGTTDLMICAYQYEPNQNSAVLKPYPLYWESFNQAGDDLLKNIVDQVVLAGKIEEEWEEGCKGVIANYARDKGYTDVAEKMQNFFGTDSNNQGHLQRIYRKNFIVQVAKPIAEKYMEHAASGLEDKIVTFDELFPDLKPNAELLDYFNAHFHIEENTTFRFQDIKWKLSTKRIFDIVEGSFDKLLKQISMLFSAFGCDFVLLAGKPTSLSKFREIMIKNYPVSPDRIITLNKYRVGRWYPFSNDIGKLEDTKSIVAVGALIALMGDKLGKLKGFRLDSRILRKELISTADYIGPLKSNSQDIDYVYLDPFVNREEIVVSDLPLTIGYKQMPNRTYPSRPIYVLGFNNNKIREKVMERNTLLDDELEILSEIDKYKNTLKRRMPFRVVLTREISESKEKIVIDQIRDINGNDASRHFLTLSLMTLPDESGYWLDKGEFILNII